MKLDKNTRILIIEERIKNIDSVIAVLKENIDGGHVNKENSPSFEQELADVISKKQALLDMKKTIEEEV